MNAFPVAERRRHVASLVLRPVDALLEAMRRPPHERRPVGAVRLRLAGRVEAGRVRPLAPGTARAVRNLSGDTVFVDLGLPAGTYRVELERDPRERRDGFYEELDAAQRDVQWSPDAAAAGPAHLTRLVELKLRPSPQYPFAPASTLVRGTLVWYDGSALAGAVVREPAALVTESRPDARGGFVLAFAAAAAGGPATLRLELGGVDAAARPSGAQYLAGWPAQWSTQWRRGSTVGVRQAALEGTVVGPGGRPLAGARVRLRGRPGTVATDGDGRWRYHFPPGTPTSQVDLRVRYPGHATVVLRDVGFAADATSRAPLIRMT